MTTTAVPATSTLRHTFPALGILSHHWSWRNCSLIGFFTSCWRRRIISQIQELLRRRKIGGFGGLLRRVIQRFRRSWLGIARKNRNIAKGSSMGQGSFVHFRGFCRFWLHGSIGSQRFHGSIRSNRLHGGVGQGASGDIHRRYASGFSGRRSHIITILVVIHIHIVVPGRGPRRWCAADNLNLVLAATFAGALA